MSILVYRKESIPAAYEQPRILLFVLRAKKSVNYTEHVYSRDLQDNKGENGG